VYNIRGGWFLIMQQSPHIAGLLLQYVIVFKLLIELLLCNTDGSEETTSSTSTLIVYLGLQMIKIYELYLWLKKKLSDQCDLDSRAAKRKIVHFLIKAPN